MSDGSNAGATEPSQGQSFKHIALLNLAILAGALVLIEGLASTPKARLRSLKSSMPPRGLSQRL